MPPRKSIAMKTPSPSPANPSRHAGTQPSAREAVHASLRDSIFRTVASHPGPLRPQGSVVSLGG